MTLIWLDNQLPPALCPWLNERFQLDAKHVSALGLPLADRLIYHEAQRAGAIIMSKDRDFAILTQTASEPVPVIWLRCGNTSNTRLRAILEQHLATALELIANGETIIEILDPSFPTTS